MPTYSASRDEAEQIARKRLAETIDNGNLFILITADSETGGILTATNCPTDAAMELCSILQTVCEGIKEAYTN